MEFSAAMIAAYLHGTVEGDANVTVNHFTKIEEGRPGALCFLSNPKYEPYLYTTDASIAIVNADLQTKEPVKCTLIRVPDAYQAFAMLLQLYQENLPRKKGTEQPCHIAESAVIGQDVYIGAFAYIGENARIGDRAQIYPNTYIGDGARIGDDTTVYAGAKIYADCQVGNRCILHAGTVIGADGFGFAPREDHTYSKIPQIGRVIIEDDVEIGANTCIDRATMGATVVRRGTKLDNLIQVAHNVEVGSDTVMAAQSGIAGSAKVGAHCVVGGQVGIAGHLHVGDGVQIAAQSGILKSVPEGRSMFGSPAFDYKDFMRSYVVFRRLAELKKQVDNLSELHKSS
ncbi:MAG: UDP-3-O-(3-hydroxymyristoyl)glucosamine N-acyltransferase [Bacteroidales bacterium]|nr:UDP-3-O-(3-hydroxymyristoyl)glucosamine N-acyltransferase [Bacteroidales bacterium]